MKYKQTQYGLMETTPHMVWYIKYPLLNVTEPYYVGEDLIQPIWAKYGSMSFPTQESAEHELDLMRKRSPEAVATWKVESGQAFRLKTPYNPFPDEPEEETL